MAYVLSWSFVTSPTGIYLLLFPLRLLGCWLLERRYLAHPFQVRDVLARDLATMLFYVVVTYPIAGYLSNRFGVALPVPPTTDEIPLLVRLALYLIVADFLHYWIHRLTHQPLLWRLHKWHHSPTHMSWTAGMRTTFLDATLVNLAYVFAWPLLGSISYRLQMLLLIFMILKNDWMHLNVNWRLPWLERWLVTPRFHHIHHSDDVAHFNRNFSPLFSVWDRMFGTHVDPDTVAAPLKFGIGEQVPMTRLVIGV